VIWTALCPIIVKPFNWTVNMVLPILVVAM
jgi:hypothetical protein